MLFYQLLTKEHLWRDMVLVFHERKKIQFNAEQRVSMSILSN